MGGLVFIGIDPTDVTACRVNNTELDVRIWIAGLWIRCELDCLAIRNVIDHGEFWHRILVESKKREGGRIRTPPVSTKVSTAIKFFLVDPIQTAVENLRAAIARQSTLATLHAEILDIQVVLTHEADHSSVRTEFFAEFLFGIACQPDSAVAAKLVVKEIVGPVNQNGSLSRVEIV